MIVVFWQTRSSPGRRLVGADERCPAAAGLLRGRDALPVQQQEIVFFFRVFQGKTWSLDAMSDSKDGGIFSKKQCELK